MKDWLLLLYKVPHKPSSRRVFVWRRLRRLGATLLSDTVWALPKTTQSLAQLQQLTEEIQQRGGTSLLWEADLAAEDTGNRSFANFLTTEAIEEDTGHARRKEFSR